MRKKGRKENDNRDTNNDREKNKNMKPDKQK